MRGEDGLKVAVKRDAQNRAGLLLPDLEKFALDMLAPHANDVRAPLSGKNHKPEGEPLARSNWVVRFKLRNFRVGPSPKSAGVADPGLVHAERRISLDETGAHGYFDNGAQRLEQVSRGVWLLLRHDGFDARSGEACERQYHFQ